MLKKITIKKEVEFKGEIFVIKYLTLVNDDNRYFTNSNLIYQNKKRAEDQWDKKYNKPSFHTLEGDYSKKQQDQWEGIIYAFEEHKIKDPNQIKQLCIRFLRVDISNFNLLIENFDKIYDNWDLFVEFIEKAKCNSKANIEEMSNRISNDFHELFGQLKELANDKKM